MKWGSRKSLQINNKHTVTLVTWSLLFYLNYPTGAALSSWHLTHLVLMEDKHLCTVTGHGVYHLHTCTSIILQTWMKALDILLTSFTGFTEHSDCSFTLIESFLVAERKPRSLKRRFLAAWKCCSASIILVQSSERRTAFNSSFRLQNWIALYWIWITKASSSFKYSVGGRTG